MTERSAQTVALAAILRLRKEMRALDAKRVIIVLDPAATPLGTMVPDRLSKHQARVRLAFGDMTRAQSLCLIDVDEECEERFVNDALAQAARENVDDAPRTVCACAILAYGDPDAGRPEKILASHMAESVMHVDPQGNERLVRWFDPRVTALAIDWIDPEQWTALLGPVAAWMFIDDEGRLQCIRSERAHASGARMKFTLEQWSRLERIAWLRNALPLAESWGVAGSTVAERAARIDGALARAQASGLRSEADALVFAACAFTLHPRFDEHPAIAAQLVAKDPAARPFAERAAEWTEPFMKEVGDGHWLKSPSVAV